MTLSRSGIVRLNKSAGLAVSIPLPVRSTLIDTDAGNLTTWYSWVCGLGTSTCQIK